MYHFDNVEYSGEQVILTGRSSIEQKPIRLIVNREGFEKYRDGALVQNAFPEMSREDRELLISGTTPEEWEDIFNCRMKVFYMLMAGEGVVKSIYSNKHELSKGTDGKLCRDWFVIVSKMDAPVRFVNWRKHYDVINNECTGEEHLGVRYYREIAMRIDRDGVSINVQADNPEQAIRLAKEFYENYGVSLDFTDDLYDAIGGADVQI